MIRAVRAELNQRVDQTSNGYDIAIIPLLNETRIVNDVIILGYFIRDIGPVNVASHVNCGQTSSLS